MELFRSKDTLRNIIIPVVISITLYLITSSAFLPVIVLLFASNKVKAVELRILPILIMILFVVIFHVSQLKDLLQTGEGFGLMIVGLYLPISTLIAGGVWIVAQKERMLYRLLYASVFAGVAGFLLVIWLTGNSASASSTREVYQGLISSLVSMFMGNQLLMQDTEVFSTIIISAITNFGLALFMSQFGVAVFLSEMLVHRFSTEYQQRMLKWNVPHDTIWFLLAGMSATLLTFLVDFTLLESLAYNTVTVIAMLYAVQGVSIASNLLVRKLPHIKPSRVFFLSGALMVLPGANVVFVIGFPLLGISETWITYRKNE